MRIIDVSRTRAPASAPARDSSHMIYLDFRDSSCGTIYCHERSFSGAADIVICELIRYDQVPDRTDRTDFLPEQP